jgi:hypothetical protein
VKTRYATILGVAAERCPSGLRSTLGKRVSVLRRFVGSNPTLSA